MITNNNGFAFISVVQTAITRFRELEEPLNKRDKPLDLHWMSSHDNHQHAFVNDKRLQEIFPEATARKTHSMVPNKVPSKET